MKRAYKHLLTPKAIHKASSEFHGYQLKQLFT